MIILALVIVGIVFGFLVRFYTERQTKNQLIREANAVFDTIKEEVISKKGISDITARQALRKKVFNELVTLESNFVLVSRDLKVLYPKGEDAERFKQQILPKIEEKLVLKAKKTVFMRIRVDKVENMLVLLPPRNNVPQGLRGWIVLYSPVGPVQKLINSMLLVLLVSLVITAVLAVIIGVFSARTIARPIIMLKNRTASLSKLNFDGSVEIHTGDELEELGKAIDKMAVSLKEHDTAQKRFFQNASHELKTPLMSIQGYAEGVKDGVFENNDEALDIIVEESKRLKGIVDELIYLSKIESQEDFYKFSPESINEVIENSIEKLKGLSVKDGVTINAILSEDIKLNIDRDKIIQALINIMGNCLRYAKSEINIITSNDNQWLEIRIHDNGKGFDENEIPRVFERFYKGKNGNSGLGLAITKVIIEKHNGFIDASNHRDGGAEFRIRLPIQKH